MTNQHDEPATFMSEAEDSCVKVLHFYMQSEYLLNRSIDESKSLLFFDIILNKRINVRCNPNISHPHSEIQNSFKYIIVLERLRKVRILLNIHIIKVI